MTPDHIYHINEKYFCLQGEGKNVGKPSFLIRFQTCNLRCTFCDTAYSQGSIKMLNSDAECDTKRQVNLKKLVEEIRQNKVISNILFTGGEPTLQPFHLIMKDLGNGYTAEVETNATYIPHEYMENFKEADYAKFQWNVSPKFNHYGGKIYSDTISFWAEKCKNFEHVYFKFVISKHRLNQDLNPVLKLIETHDIPIKNVYFMPEGTGLNSQIQNQWLHEICLKYGISYSPRLQVILFGDRRGV